MRHIDSSLVFDSHLFLTLSLFLVHICLSP
ncbi:hypothetical protein CABS01_15440 [Colletotrichum abscissum]|uniref:Uncharacterized protein n=3 Tax=Colletotrichum acutatum species complex TaxID=2707335 RepID=A0AAI9Z8A9_9PEZI|nr:uncharacterized protein CCOS01_02711 [Colletotrichum costaricense]XP_060383306.1 uncharacterized protein CTAM01_06086 [Colletotrichum tamarilloi]XP_060391765.1 uncharacterized protein CABS01_15440 [Colletotrichum abscissum]KAI3533134.1 hypothetical protein CSPX01_12931 [Colletotrichum filicis]KAK1497628.1 hypothetical protein CCUS01_13021 [Colletotrichum cuscutae]KAK1476218.1 hypothetical protein CABS01_15440 [Colletotrichum abscissum]KAK1501361.1 hypothetical protein CTAM01_06086 [Colleto